MSQKKLYDAVVRICNRVPQASNDRIILTEQVFYEYGWSDTKSLYSNLVHMPRVESIMRRLREAIANGDVVVSTDERKRLDDAARNELDRFSDFNTRLINNHIGRE